MRPYLAVIVDSFRAAMASRVLWILLILITIFLIALAPLSLRQVLTSNLDWRDLREPRQLMERLHAEFEAPGPSPGKHIWRLLDEDSRDSIEKITQAKASDFSIPARLHEVVEELNGLLSRRDFYDARAWADVELKSDAVALLDRGVDQLTEEELRRLNRLLLESAYRGLIATSPENSLQLYYLVWEFGSPIPMPGQNPTELVSIGIAWFLDYIIDFIVGVFGIFVAILVTAPIIPETYENGSIELLLSKPISRPMLFLAKFVGSCSFVLVNVGYLLLGIWLIAGLRMGVWDATVLLGIPLFLFYFVIFYSVSALTGLIWRSAIVSVALTLLFWASCVTVGMSKSVLEALVLSEERIVEIVPTEDAPICVTEDNTVNRWDAEQQEWREIFRAQQSGPPMMPIELPSPRMVGPVYRHRAKQLLAVSYLAFGPRAIRTNSSLQAASPVDLWTRKEIASAPSGTVGLFVDSQENVIVVAQDGVFRLPGEGVVPDQRRMDDDLFVDPPSFQLVMTGSPPRWWDPQVAAKDTTGDRIAVWNFGTLAVLAADEAGNYGMLADTEIQQDEQAVLLAMSGSTILVAQTDGIINVLDAKSLDVRETLQPDGHTPARFLRASGDGRWFAIVLHNGQLWMYDAQQQELSQPGFVGQGDISAAAFADAGSLLVADRTTRVSRYRLDGLQQVEQLAPKMGTWELIYRYGVLPLYTVFPKPTELDNTVQYLMTEQETSTGELSIDDLRDARETHDPWAPVVSSAAFVLLLLVICCLFSYRAEF